MPTYIQKRRRRWYAVLEIPMELRRRGLFGGKPRFVQSLQTESETVARRRAGFLVNAWKKDISEARGEPGENDALYWRSVLKRAKTDKERLRIMEQIHEAAELIGMETVDEIGQDPTSSPEARKFYSDAVGWTTQLGEHIDDWQEAIKSSVGAKTRAVYKADVERFMETFKTVQAVTRPEVKRWFTRLTSETTLAPTSIARIKASLKSYWRYLSTIKAVPEGDNPLDNLDLRLERNSKARKWLPLKPSDVVFLHKEALKLGDQQLADLIDVGRWTGARIEELCKIKVEDIHDLASPLKTWLAVEDAKTEAGIRDVPVHPKLVATLRRLVGERKQGWLFEKLTEDKYGDRSRSIAQRFSRLKRQHGFGARHVFHSIRKTVTTQFDDAMIPESVAADIIGHDKPTMTYGVYSGGASMTTKRKAIHVLRYPD